MWNGKNLNTVRVDNELTEADLGYIVEILPNEVKDFERGVKIPTQSEVEKLQKALNVSKGYFEVGGNK